MKVRFMLGQNRARRMRRHSNVCWSFLISLVIRHIGHCFPVMPVQAFAPCFGSCNGARQPVISPSRIFVDESVSSEQEDAAQVSFPPPSIQETLEDFRSQHSAGNQLTQETCDELLAQCVAQNEWDAVLEALDLMKVSGWTQERTTYQACLRACQEAGNGVSAAEILKAMSEAGELPSATDASRVVRTVVASPTSKLSEEACEVIARSLVRGRQWKDSIRFLRFLEDSNQATVSTYEAVCDCCNAAGQLEQTVQVLQSCVKAGLVPSLHAFESVVQSLCRRLQWRRSLFVMEDLMDPVNLTPTVRMYNSLLTACAKAREVVQAKNLLVQMRRKHGLSPDIFSFNAVLSACASAERWKDALTILDQCHREPGVTPDIYTYTNAMRACAKAGKTRRALTLLQVVKDKGLPVDAYCYTAAIEACARARMWKKALELLDEMKTCGIQPSEVTYSVTVTALGNGGEWQKALDLLDQMRSENMSVNLITYNAAITCLSKAAKRSAKLKSGENGLWMKVLDLLEQMKQDGLEPDGFSFSAAISCCGAEGRWEEALDLIDVMQNGGPRTRPNKIAYTAAIASCGRSGQVDHAARLFRQMKEQGLSADRVAYNALFLAFRIAKRADAAAELWDEMIGLKQHKGSKIATAKRDTSTTPDIISLTDAIGAMSSSSKPKDLKRVDRVFTQAVERGIVLSRDSLDSRHDIDLSGMSLPVARFAMRYIFNRLVLNQEESELVDLTLITGVGAAKGAARRSPSRAENDERSLTSLREYVQDVLATDFSPSLKSVVPKLAQGTVVVEQDVLKDWARQQDTRRKTLTQKR